MQTTLIPRRSEASENDYESKRLRKETMNVLKMTRKQRGAATIACSRQQTTSTAGGGMHHHRHYKGGAAITRARGGAMNLPSHIYIYIYIYIYMYLYMFTCIYSFLKKVLSRLAPGAMRQAMRREYICGFATAMKSMCASKKMTGRGPGPSRVLCLSN